AHDLPGDPVVAVPARDVLLITGADSPPGLAKAGRCVDRVHFAGSHHLLTQDLLVRTGNRWRVFDPADPADEPTPDDARGPHDRPAPGRLRFYPTIVGKYADIQRPTASNRLSRTALDDSVRSCSPPSTRISVVCRPSAGVQRAIWSTSSTESAARAASPQRARLYDAVEQATSTGASMSSPLWTRAWPNRIARSHPARTGNACNGFQPRSYSHSPSWSRWIDRP